MATVLCVQDRGKQHLHEPVKLGVGGNVDVHAATPQSSAGIRA